MLMSFVLTALVMGLGGGPHCLAMCAAPCGAITAVPSIAPVGLVPVDGISAPPPALSGTWWQRMGLFQAGRVLGYALAGGVAALAMERMAWLTQQTEALHPLWTFLHVLVLAWGLLMLFQSRQPAWVENAGRRLWGWVQPRVQGRGSVAGFGVFWALMPCSLLYSALLVAALSGGPLQGAVTMAAFALGSGIWLWAAPWLWGRLREKGNRWRSEWGTRISGGLLCGVALWALWMDLIYKPSLWCR